MGSEIESASMQPLREPPEAAKRLLALAAVSGVACGLQREEIVSWLKRENLWQSSSPSEQRFLLSPAASQRDTIYFTWQMEAAYVLGWALKLTSDFAPLTAQASLSTILEKTPGPGEATEQFVASCSLRPPSDIYSKADFLLNAHASCRDSKRRGIPEPNGYDIGVVQERHRAINWLTRYTEADWDEVTTDT